MADPVLGPVIVATRRRAENARQRAVQVRQKARRAVEASRRMREQIQARASHRDSSRAAP